MLTSRKMNFGRYDYAAFMSFISYAAGSVVVPVALVQVARELGFNLAEGGFSAGGALHLGRTTAIVAAMLLCGFIAGRWGKRKTVGFSVVLMALGMAACAFTPTYSILFLALLIAGLGEGVIEGLTTPFVRELHPEEAGRYINFSHAFWSVGVLTTVLICGWLLSREVSWRILVAAVAVLGFITSLIILLPESKGRQYPEHPEPIHWKTVCYHAQQIFHVKRFWIFFAAMFLAGGGEFCLTFWSASYIQLHFNTAAWAGGVGTACFAAGMVLGRTGWGYIIKQHQLRNLVLYSALAGSAITVTFPLLNNLWLFFLMLFFAGIATAPFWPSIQSYAVDQMPANDTTMLLILLSCAGIPGCGVFTWLMGYIGNLTGSLNAAFYLVPACYLILATLIALPARSK